MNLDLTDEEAAALTKHLREALDLCALPARAAAQSAQIHPRQDGTAEAEAGTLTAAHSRHGADPRAGKTETVKLPSTLRRSRAFWISACNIIGLLFSMAGVVLLFRFALPVEAPGGPEAQWRNAIAASAPQWEAVERRYNWWAFTGLVLIVVGTAMEAVPPACTAFVTWRRRRSPSKRAGAGNAGTGTGALSHQINIVAETVTHKASDGIVAAAEARRAADTWARTAETVNERSNPPSAPEWHLTETYKSLITLSVEGLKTLALINGGAAVAILAYLGSLASHASAPAHLPAVKLALLLYCGGLSATGMAFIAAYSAHLWLYRDEIILRDQGQVHHRHRRPAIIGIVLAFLAVLAFAGGCMFAADALIP